MLGHSNQKQESLVYVVLWTALFIAPVASIQFHHTESEVYPWHELLDAWLQMAVMFACFLFHNYVLAPWLVYGQRRLLYFTSVMALTCCFVILQCTHQPEQKGGPPPLPVERSHEHRPPLPDDGDAFEPHADRPPFVGHEGPDIHPPAIFGQHDVLSAIMLILMLGMNIGVKLYFKQRDDQQRLERMEKESLHQQLEYLRYQINPHFLMNTLNNIHALVDIDGERAKDTIVELSRIMRYALYEGSRQYVPLSRDVEFVESYIRLMRLRYTDKVSISVSIPPVLPDRQVPPMLFVTFVENAFKHGVSYQQESFISISFAVTDDRLRFVCSNSKPLQPNKHAGEEGGVGLQNVQRRLQLIYGDRYSLKVTDTADAYTTELELPLWKVQDQSAK